MRVPCSLVVRHSSRLRPFHSGPIATAKAAPSSTIPSPHGDPSGPCGLDCTPAIRGYSAADSAEKSVLGSTTPSASTAKRPSFTRTMATGSRHTISTVAPAGCRSLTSTTRLTHGCMSKARANRRASSGSFSGSLRSRLALRRASVFRSQCTHGATPRSWTVSASRTYDEPDCTPSSRRNQSMRPKNTAPTTTSKAPKPDRRSLRNRPMVLSCDRLAEPNLRRGRLIHSPGLVALTRPLSEA